MMLRALSWLLEAVFWAVAGGLALLVLSGCLFPVAGWLSPLLAFFLWILAARTMRQVRQQRALTVLGYLDQAVRLNLPAPPMLAAAERSETSGTRRRLAALRRAIESGLPLADALDHDVPEVSLETVSLVSAGERLGRLPQAVRYALERQRRAVDTRTFDTAFGWAYGIAVAAVTALLATGYLIFIGPQLEHIAEDFDTQMPWTTRLTIDIGRTFGPTIALVTASLVLAVLGYHLATLTHPEFSRLRRVRGLLDRVVWCVPFVGRVARDRGLADVFAVIADGLKSGAPLVTLLGEASELQVNAVLRDRLQHMVDGVAAGDRLGEAARRAWLPRFVVGMLGGIDRGADAHDTCDFLSRYYLSRFSRGAELLRASFVPVMVLTLALIVGWLVFSLFQPLVALIWQTIYVSGVF